MKKIIVILLVFILSLSCCFAITNEEFNEVYNALEESTKVIEELSNTIASLQDKILLLETSNKVLEQELQNSKTMISILDNALTGTEKNLEKSNKIIKSLNNQKFLLGITGGVDNIGLNNNINFGIGVNIGYKLWLGYLSFSITGFTDKTINTSIGYNFIF